MFGAPPGAGGLSLNSPEVRAGHWQILGQPLTKRVLENATGCR